MVKNKLLIFLIIFILSSSLVLSYRQAITPSFFFSSGNITLNLTNYYLKTEVYNKTEVDQIVSGIVAGDYDDTWINNTFYNKTQSDDRYLTSYTETDPLFTGHVSSSITTTNITNWNTAYGWGNHALAGYLTSYTETDPIWTSEKNNYYTKLQTYNMSEIDTFLLNYYLKTEVYNKTEIDNLPVSYFNNDIGYLTNITDESILSLSDVNNQTLNNGSLMTWNIEQQYFEFIYNINDYYTNETDIHSTQIKMNQDFELYDWFNTLQSAGRVSGGLITDNGDGTVHIAAGEGLIKSMSSSPNDGEQCEKDNCASISETLYVTWNEVLSLVLIDNAYNYIYYDGSDGTIKTTTDFYSIDYTQDFTLGRAYKDNGNIVVRLCGTNLWNFNRRVQLFGEEVYPIKRASGLILSQTGTLNIKVTGGILWAELLNRFTTETVDTSLTGNFTYWYLNSTGGWVRTDGVTQINNQHYNLIGTGLQTLTPNRYGVHWVYVVHDGTVHVVYGRDNYQLNNAQLSTPPQELPGLVDAYATLVGRIIVQRDATSFTEIASAFDQVFTTSQATIHNELAGLQGGAINEYYHLNLANYTYLTNNTFLTSYTETDPLFTGHVSSNITTTNITNWNTAYGWGNHASVGYLTSYTETDPVWLSEKNNYYNQTESDNKYAQVDTANSGRLIESCDYTGTCINSTGLQTAIVNTITYGNIGQYAKSNGLFGLVYTNTIPVSDITGLDYYNTTEVDNLPISTFNNDVGYITGYTVTSNDVTQHQADINITESQITDLQSYYLASNPDGYITNNLTTDLNTKDIIIDEGNSFYFNDKTSDGSWRVRQDGSDLVFEKKVSGSWVKKIVYD